MKKKGHQLNSSLSVVLGVIVFFITDISYGMKTGTTVLVPSVRSLNVHKVIYGKTIWSN